MVDDAVGDRVVFLCAEKKQGNGNDARPLNGMRVRRHRCHQSLDQAAHAVAAPTMSFTFGQTKRYQSASMRWCAMSGSASDPSRSSIISSPTNSGVWGFFWGWGLVLCTVERRSNAATGATRVQRSLFRRASPRIANALR